MKQKTDKTATMTIHPNGIVARTKNKRVTVIDNIYVEDGIIISIEQVEKIDELPVVKYKKIRNNYFENRISLKRKTAEILHKALELYLTNIK